MTRNWKTAGMLLALMTTGSPCLAKDQVGTIAHPLLAKGRVPGVLVLGGAEGGDKWAKAVAQQLAEHGYAALAEAYFKAPGLDEQLLQIPLERLKRGVDQLAEDPRVDPQRIAVLGLSKGAEAALLLAASDARIRAVVAGSPTDVVWQGIDRKTGTVQSSWSQGGQPLPFVPFLSCDQCSLGALYTKKPCGARRCCDGGNPGRTHQGADPDAGQHE